MALPIRAKPRFPHSQSLPSRSFHNPLIHIHQRAYKMKTTSQKTNQTDHMDHSLVWLNETMSHAMQGHPRWTGHGTEFWQNMVHWRREWQTTSVFLSWEPHEQNERQKDLILTDDLPRSVGVQYDTGEKWRNSSRKNEEAEPKQKHHPVVDVTGDGSKVRCCKNNIP